MACRFFLRQQTVIYITLSDRSLMPLCTMNTYRIVPTTMGFRVIETSPSGQEIITHDFQTEASARVWIVKRATVTNLADLARWLRGDKSGR